MVTGFYAAALGILITIFAPIMPGKQWNGVARGSALKVVGLHVRCKAALFPQ